MFLEKYAKLKSEVDDSGEFFRVNVYDDEIEDGEVIMWMDFVPLDLDSVYSYTGNDELESFLDQEGIDEFIYVDVVDFNDDIYFNLPQNKQDVCATVLFKRFIKYYMENYEGWPIRTNFYNYALQEKFKVAVQKGIFPKESLTISEFTDAKNWNNEDYYNRDSREEQWLIKNVVTSIFQEQNIQIENDTWVIGTPISQFENILDFLKQTLKEEHNIELKIEDQLKVSYTDVYGFIYNIPIELFNTPPHSEFKYSLSDKKFYTHNYANFIKEHKEEFEFIFDTTQIIATNIGSIGENTNEFFAKEISSFIKKRLFKKG